MSDGQYIYLIKFDSNGNQVLPGLARNAHEAHNAFDQLKERTEGLNNILTKFGIGFLGWEMVSKLKEIGTEAMMTEAKFSKMGVLLKNILGSNNEAKETMDMIREFAATTPYQVDVLTDSFVKLANRGVKMTKEQMTSTADVAASFGKGFEDVIQAILLHDMSRAWRTLGIKQEKDGDKIKLTYRGITQTVADTEAGALKAITAFGKMNGVMGATKEIMGTTGGALSNLKDKEDEMYKAMGEKMKPLTDAWIRFKGSIFDATKDYFEVKDQDKLTNEINNIRVLHTEMTSIGTSEARRKQILQELKDINEDVTKGIDEQAISYDKLNSNINKVIQTDLKKIVLDNNKDELKKIQQKELTVQGQFNKDIAQGAQMIQKYRPDLENNQKMAITTKMFETWKSMNVKKDANGNAIDPTMGDFMLMGNIIDRMPGSRKKLTELTLEKFGFDKKIKEQEGLLGISETGKKSEGKIAGSGDASEKILKGGSSQKIINITVHKFQDKIEQHISTEPGDAKRKAEEVYEQYNEYFMRVLNSANQAAN